MSLAASAERCASARTSEATTAKPLPASPARAASTPALSANKLVWKAISSITPMMRPICSEDLEIASIASTACLTTTAPFLASSSALATTSLACFAPSADFFSVAVISLSAAAVSSRLAACCSVRRESSSEAAEISRAPEWIASCCRRRRARLHQLLRRRVEIVADLGELGGEIADRAAPPGRRRRGAANLRRATASPAVWTSAVARLLGLDPPALGVGRGAMLGGFRSTWTRSDGVGLEHLRPRRPSRRPRRRGSSPSISTLRSPCASAFMRSTMLVSGRVTFRVVIHSANAPASRCRDRRPLRPCSRWRRPPAVALRPWLAFAFAASSASVNAFMSAARSPMLPVGLGGEVWRRSPGRSAW